MAVIIRKITLWRVDVENRPGALAGVLEPLANAGADLDVVMGYPLPGDGSRAAIEVSPVSGKKVVAAAVAAGLNSSSIPSLVVQGDNKPGLGHAITRSLAEAGINITFAVAQVIGRRFTAIFGFESEAHARQAASLIRRATTRGRR